MRNFLPIPAWSVMFMIINFQIAMMLEAMELSDELGGSNLVNYPDWVVLAFIFIFITILVIYAIIKGSFLLVIPAFLFDFFDLVYDFFTGNPYFIPQLILFISFWVVPSFIFLSLRYKKENSMDIA